MPVHEGSRYTGCSTYPTFGRGDKLVVALDTERAEIYIPTGKELQHIVTKGDRLDLLAYKYYRDPQLGWAILDANGLFSEFELTLGLRIIIPPIESIRRS